MNEQNFKNITYYLYFNILSLLSINEKMASISIDSYHVITK